MIQTQNTIDPRQLTQDLGGKWAQSYGTAPCPICQDRRKDQNALTIRTEGDRLLLHCKKSNCSFTDLLKAAGIAPGTFEVDPAAQREADQARAEFEAHQLNKARNAWAYGKPIIGTKGEAYLRARGITCDLPDTLRWVSDCYHGPSGRFVSAMVGNVQPTGGVHRTFFEKSGERIAKNAKMMLGPCAGGAVRLSEAVGPLVVCEGIETGLSLMSGLLDGPASVWAALSTSGIRALNLPPRPPSGSLVIATDGDTPGREAGAVLADRANALGWPVSIMTAPEGQDFNDVLQQGGEA